VAAVLRGGRTVEREERKGGARGGEETVLILYRAEGEREEARKAVRSEVGGASAINGGGGSSGSGGACGGGERVWEHGRVKRAAAGALGCAFIGQGGKKRATSGCISHQWPWGPAAFIAFKGEA
jgi:hypothetical protein